ncbi:MAG: zinc ribbon domain-containing protein [Candidatus Helarchaeota archaeon]
MNSKKTILGVTCSFFIIVGVLFIISPFIPLTPEYYDDDPTIAIIPDTLKINNHTGGFYNDETIKFTHLQPPFYFYNSISLTVQSDVYAVQIFILAEQNYLNWNEDVASLPSIAVSSIDIPSGQRIELNNLTSYVTVGGNYYIVVTNNTAIPAESFDVYDLDINAQQSFLPTPFAFLSIIWLFIPVCIIILYIYISRRGSKPKNGIVIPREEPSVARPEPISFEAEREISTEEESVLTENPVQVKCPDCGRMNDIDAEFCSHCGKKLEKIHFCKNCHAILEKDDKICSKCGAIQ